MKASEVVFQKLLDGKIQYVVPLYQRTYDWDEEQWEKLWSDLLDIYALPSPRNHFIGSVVTQSIPTPPEGPSMYTLIDGQQRMTTLFILLSVIRKHAETESETWGQLAEEILDTCLVNKFVDGNGRNKLMPTQRDRDAFASVVRGEEPDNSLQIAKARTYFDKALDDEGNKIDLRKLHSCIVNHLDLVSISLDQEDSPNRIFESLNNTGMPLTVADLLRNYLLMNIPDPQQQEQAYDTYWYPMQELLSAGKNKETRGKEDVSDDFFWRYLMMDGSLPRKDDVYDEIQKHINASTPEKAEAGQGQTAANSAPTPEQAQKALESFHKFSRYYGQIAELQNVDRERLSTLIQRLNQWGVAPAYPFLMKAFDSLSSGKISEDELVSVMGMIESFVVRRTVCGVPTNRLRRIFARMSGQLNLDDVVGYSSDYLSKNEWPSDDEFRSKFKEVHLYNTSRLNQTRLVLESLEASFGHQEPPELNDNITIEHIMPQTLSDEWQRDLGPNATDIHGQWLHTIGNLTLTGYNAELSNKPFAEKRVDLAGSNFALNATIGNFDVWNEESIQSRADWLADQALRCWPR